jgi:hypothetical protein
MREANLFQSKRALFLTSLFFAVVLYLSVTLLIQRIFITQLEKSVEIQLSGRNLSPFSLSSIHFENLEVKREGVFVLRAKQAVFYFSPPEVFFGHIPLVLRAQNLLLMVSDGALKLLIPEVPFESLSAKLDIFSGKGFRIHEFNLKGKSVEFTGEGRILKKGLGPSDVSASFSIDEEDSRSEAWKLFTKNLLTKTAPDATTSGKLTFNFRLQGDLASPAVSLDSNLVSFNIQEKAETL